LFVCCNFVQNMRLKIYPKSFRPKRSFVESIPGNAETSSSPPAPPRAPRMPRGRTLGPEMSTDERGINVMIFCNVFGH
jgi:hypothetical protein